MSTYNKHSQIFGIGFIPVANAVIRDFPGCNIIQVSGEWVEIPIMEGEFKEKMNTGNLIEQELKVSVADTGTDSADLLRNLFSQEGLVKMKFTNGLERVAGTNEFPLLVAIEEAGSPAVFNLSFNRNSPEPSKILKSF